MSLRVTRMIRYGLIRVGLVWYQTGPQIENKAKLTQLGINLVNSAEAESEQAEFENTSWDHVQA
jgi:hypothetical protein